jgi:soluble lytic murein transglycosylase-like protein
MLIWLPVLLAASFPIGAITALAAFDHPTSRPIETQSQQPTVEIPEAFTKEVQYWAPEIARWSIEYEIPMDLIATVMQIESCGHPQVHSPAGAIGLFQVMPFHFDAEDDPMLPETNAARGLRYLARALELGQGDSSLALAGYNGGHSLIGRDPSAWPNETLRYVDWGSRILLDVELGLSVSPGVQAWLAAGGAGLCRRAADHLGLE